MTECGSCVWCHLHRTSNSWYARLDRSTIWILAFAMESHIVKQKIIQIQFNKSGSTGNYATIVKHFKI